MHDKINKEREAIRQDNSKNTDKPKQSNSNGDRTGKTRKRSKAITRKTNKRQEERQHENEPELMVSTKGNTVTK